MRSLAVLLMLMLTVNVVLAQAESKDSYVKEGSQIAATLYHDNGMISQQGTYNLEGKLHGKWISYDNDGNKTAIAYYENGQKVGTWFFWRGSELHEVTYANAKISTVSSWSNKETQVVSYR